MSAPQTAKAEARAGWRLAVCGIRIECGALRLAAIFIAALPRSKA
ncbi:hypothetical protein LJR016_000856 [Devosia sp. LjRoot16]